MSDNANTPCKTDVENSEIVEKQIHCMNDGQIVDFSRQLIHGRHLSELEKLFNSLEVDTLSRLTENEDFLQIFLKFKLLQGCWLDVIEILKTKERRFSKPVFLSLWDEANYQKYQADNKGAFTTLVKYRVRQRNPPPESICPYGIRPCRLLPTKSVSVLQKWFNAHKDHPYPCKSTKAKLAKVTGIPVRKVTTWFQNFRRKYKKQLINEALTENLQLKTENPQNMSSPSQPNVHSMTATDLSPDVKYNILPQSRKIEMCDAATQSEETVTMVNIPNISIVTNNIDQLDNVTELVPLHQSGYAQGTEASLEQGIGVSQKPVPEKSRAQIIDRSREEVIKETWKQGNENRQVHVDLNNNDTDCVHPLSRAPNDVDKMKSVPMVTGQSSGQEMNSLSNINITDYALPMEPSDSEAQFRYLIDACSWNEPVSPPITNVYNNCSSMPSGELVSPLNVSVSLNDQERKYGNIKSPVQANTANILKLPDECITQSNVLHSSMNTNAPQGNYIMPKSNTLDSTIDYAVPDVITPVVNSRITDNSHSSSDVKAGQCTCVHTSVLNCPNSIEIAEQICLNKWKCPQCCTCNLTTNVLHAPFKGIQEDKGYSWQSANHSQTISELGKNATWKHVAECKDGSEDYEWKSLDIDESNNTASAGLVPDTSNICDITSNTSTCIGSLCKGRHSSKHDIDTVGKLHSKRIPLSNQFNVHESMKCVRHCRRQRNMISPVPYTTRHDCHNRVTISQRLQCTLKACLNKGSRSFLVCDQCKEQVNDVGTQSLQALQTLCNSIETSVQSPIDLAAQICSEMEKEMESEICDDSQQQIPDNDQVVPLQRCKNDRPLDMRLATGPLDKSKENDGRQPYQSEEGNNTVLFGYYPMSINVPYYREEVRPINMQITYEMDTNAPMRVQIAPEAQPIGPQSMQGNIAQSVSPELEGSYGSVVAEAIQGLLYMSSSQESE